MSIISITKPQDSIMIAWQSAEITIPLKDIITISTNDVPYNKLDHVVYIGTPSSSKNRILVHTTNLNFIIFVVNPSIILEEINIE
ncbi:SunI/YnzG family protein [Bacillus sp. FSL P2-0099]|uniref:SunI/YnzG family protein n=1 Tax=Bacillus sp. FSL P2-0099 TaxID=2921572 RepID=UPI0030F74D50